MSIEWKIDELEKLMVDFYMVTGQHCAIFDADYNVLFEKERERSRFCTDIRCLKTGAKRCAECDRYGMEQAKKSGKVFTYRCHAGFVEVCAPIDENGELLGFIMFGNFIYNENVDEQKDEINRRCADIIDDLPGFSETIKNIKVIDTEYLNSVIHILKALIGYIRLEQMVTAKEDGLWGEIKRYIKEHTGQSFKLSEMSKSLSVSIPTLCKCAKVSSGKSIGQIVNDEKLEKAKTLLSTTNLMVSEVAHLSGFNDYNYFSRFFRNNTAMSPREWRKLHS